MLTLSAKIDTSVLRLAGSPDRWAALRGRGESRTQALPYFRARCPTARHWRTQPARVGGSLLTVATDSVGTLRGTICPHELRDGGADLVGTVFLGDRQGRDMVFFPLMVSMGPRLGLRVVPVLVDDGDLDTVVGQAAGARFGQLMF
jgi:hypothetical protein